MLKLYSYFRSSASYRVRIALHWKNLEFEYLPIHLVQDGGLQNKPEFRAINPMGHVPAIDHDGFLVAESMAILDYLDRIYPQRPLIPLQPRPRAQVMQICELINSGIQPLQNLKVLGYLEKKLNLPKPEADKWVRHWIEDGFANLEKVLERTSGKYSFGDEVTTADCFLVPQCFAARRFGVPVDRFPIINRIDAAATQLQPFQKAHPEKQMDYKP